MVSVSKKARLKFAADFETTTDPFDCRVWLWGIANLENPEVVDHGLDIHSFIERAQFQNGMIYFHNLKFDGMFIIDWLLNHGYEYVETEGRIGRGTFKALISDMGKFYSITVHWNNGFNTEFRDSLKKLPMTVREVAKAFDMEEGKGDLDYEKVRPVGYQPSWEELDYLRRDVAIVARAIAQTHENGMSRLTVASDALAEYKKLITPTTFSRIFPTLSEEMDAEIRRAYRGGFTYADERYKGYITGSGLVLDVNSLYPSVMKNALLPYGEPQYFSGPPQPTDSHPLTIFSVTLIAKIKPDHIPCIQIKGTSMFAPTEYLREIEEPTTLMMTNVDFDLYNDHYDIEVLEWGGGWRFNAAVGLFDVYIDKWARRKEHSTGGQKTIAKLHLNSLYGKLASNPNVTSKIPILEDGIVKLKTGKNAVRAPVYTAGGVFITSYARDLTIRAAQENYDTFAYADTDSLHLLQDNVPDTINVHPTEMGAWKLEYKFDSAFYIRAKAYMEHIYEDGKGNPKRKFETHIAGLPEHVTESLTFDDLKDGSVLSGKLVPQTVPGGVVLKDIPFKLKL